MKLIRMEYVHILSSRLCVITIRAMHLKKKYNNYASINYVNFI